MISANMNPERDTWVILGASVLQVPLIEAVQERHQKTIVVDQNPEAPGMKIADLPLAISTGDTESLIQALEPMRDSLISVITSGTDQSLVCAVLNERLGLSGIPIAAAEILTDKGKMRNFFAKHEIPQPEFLVLEKEDSEAARKWAQQFPSQDGYVIKPLHNMGARGVLFLKDPEEFDFGMEYAARFSREPFWGIILEHYIPAEEISVDALVYRGQVCLTGVASRVIELYRERFFIERGHIMPLQRRDRATTEQKILKLLEQVVKALAIETGSVYTGAVKGDIRLQRGQLYVGEIAARLSGGFMSTHTFPYSTGINLMNEYLRLAEDKIPNVFTKDLEYERVSAEFSIPPPAEGGILEQIKTPPFDNFTQIRNVFRMFQEGQLTKDLTGNTGKILHVVYSANSLKEIEKARRAFEREVQIVTNPSPYSKEELRKAAKKKFNAAACWVCRVCDGINCASGVPGMGGAGHMNSFRDNLRALADYKLKPRYLDPELEKDADTSFSFAGKTLAGPLLSAPITGSKTNMGSSTTELDYAMDTGFGMAQAGLLPMFGDGAAPTKYKTGLAVIEMLGWGIPIFKPRSDIEELQKRVLGAREAGATAWGMDIDALSFPTMQRKKQKTRRYSPEELRALRDLAGIPMILKGVMSVEDATAAAEAGADVILVSNHGGRVLDQMPGTSRVLPLISEYIQGHHPHLSVWIDGGIRTGQDLFIALALGASAALIGRPICIAAIGLGRTGVHSYAQRILEELRHSMRYTGVSKLEDIRRSHIYSFAHNG